MHVQVMNKAHWLAENATLDFLQLKSLIEYTVASIRQVHYVE